MDLTRINDACPHCLDPILPGEPVRAVTVAGEPEPQFCHIECIAWMTQGCAAHQLRECGCFGGTRHDPPGMTARQAARLAYETFQWLHDPAGAVLQAQTRGLD